jgi:hypothetical protein
MQTVFYIISYTPQPTTTHVFIVYGNFTKKPDYLYTVFVCNVKQNFAIGALHYISSTVGTTSTRTVLGVGAVTPPLGVQDIVKLTALVISGEFFTGVGG